MRAYKLQDDGLDTLDANTTLGFDDDERDYGVAVRMLQILGCTRVKLLTNNPAKLDWSDQGGHRGVRAHSAARAGQCRQPPLSHRQGDARRAQARQFDDVEPVNPAELHVESGSGRGHPMSDMAADAAVPGYTPAARVLHWITAVLVLLMIPLGIVIANEWGGPAQQFLYNLHKSIGATLIPLVIIRLLYRLTHPPPPLPS